MSEKISGGNDYSAQISAALKKGMKAAESGKTANLGVFQENVTVDGDVNEPLLTFQKSDSLVSFSNKSQETDMNSDGSDTKVTTTTDEKGNVTTVVETLDSDGKVLNKNSTVKNKNGKLIREENIDYTYHKNGKLKKTKNVVKTTSGQTITELSYNKDGKIQHKEVNNTVTKNGKTLTNTKNTDFKYKDGKLTSTITTGTDQTGKNFKTVDNFEADGKTLKNRTQSYWKRGALVNDYFEGENLKNRTSGGLPSERIVYESDGKTVKHTIKNEFDANGVLIGRQKLDANGKIIEQKDFSKVDGKFDTAYQIGKGDCYLLSAINALSSTEAGEKLLEQNITKAVNEKGETVYTINFPGAEKARDSLINGTGNANLEKLPEDKVHIQGSYTVTEAELEEAAKRAGKDYSAGDKDVLLLEVAYEKYRNDVAQTIKDNNIDPRKTSYIAGLGIGGISEGDNLSGGNAAEATFILTGQQCELYRNNEDVPTCYVDSDMNLHLVDEYGNLPENLVKAGTTVMIDGGKTSVDKILDDLRKDYRDGKIDNYAATVGVKVSSQEVNGEVIPGSGHALTILGVTDNEVILSNPWDPDNSITMSIEDFKKAATKATCLSLNNSQIPQHTQNPQQNNSQNQISQQIVSTQPTSPSASSPSNPAPSISPQQIISILQTSPSATSSSSGTQSVTLSGQQQPHKPNYTVPQGMGYTQMIKDALIKQGIKNPTRAQIAKAKEQFVASNPKGTVHIYNGKNKQQIGNEFLLANAEVYIPKFSV